MDKKIIVLFLVLGIILSGCQIAKKDLVIVKNLSCGDSVTFNYKGSSVTYGIVESQNECWLDRNLGASRVATSYDDKQAYGDLFQWGRLDDGHQNRNSEITNSLSITDNPGHDKFIIYNDSICYDWRISKNNDLWQGIFGINNPCPKGWRLPTEVEWNTERGSWYTSIWMIRIEKYYYGAYASPLKLIAAGRRRYKNGMYINDGGYYWLQSSFSKGTSGYGDLTSSRGLGAGGYYTNFGIRSEGYSVRCIKD